MIKESDSEKIVTLPGERDKHYYTQLLSKHLQFIEKQIIIALKMLKIEKPMHNSFRMEDEAIQIFNTLVDKLKANDYRIIRQFKGRSKFTTYLSSIISREVVNMIRKKRGRKRGKERAKALDVENQPIIKKGKVKPENGELIVIDRSANPEDQIISRNGKQKTREALKKVLSSLSREERLLLKMRFPADENEEPLDMDTISSILKENKKTIYSRLSRLLTKCREMILAYGITIDDYFN